MDSFDRQRLQVYRHKIFQGKELSDDQRNDFQDLKKRQTEENARRVLREEREEARKQAEEDRKSQRELFQQQRELMILRRRINPRHELHDYDKLPRNLPEKPLSPLDNTSSTSFRSTQSTIRLSPLDDSKELPPNPISASSSSKDLERILTVGELYASPDRNAAANARAHTLALQKAQREQSAIQSKLEEEYFEQKMEKRRAATLRRNSSDIDNETYNARNRGMKFKRVRAPSPDGDIVGSSDTSDETISNSTSTSENNLKDLRVKINQPYHIPQHSIHSYDNYQSYEDKQNNSEDTTRGDLVANDRQAGVIYIETFDVLLQDIRGPLGKHSGGLRRYFKKLLENFVSTGCVYRTVNKIGICVHGTNEVLDIVKRVLDHAMKKTVTPQHKHSQTRGDVPAISWKYRSTGRTARHGIWEKHFTTRLCENAEPGKYSPRNVNDGDD